MPKEETTTTATTAAGLEGRRSILATRNLRSNCRLPVAAAELSSKEPRNEKVLERQQKYVRTLRRKGATENLAENGPIISPSIPKPAPHEIALERKVARLEELVENLVESVETLSTECTSVKAALSEALEEAEELTKKLSVAEDAFKQELEEKMKYWEALTQEKNTVRVLEAALQAQDGPDDMEYRGYSQQPWLCDAL